MKKLFVILALALAAAITVSASGCTKKEGKGDSDKIVIRMITDPNGIDDKSFNAAAWRGILKFYGDTWDNPKGRGEYYDYIVCSSEDAWVPTVKQAADKDYDLIIAYGITAGAPLEEVADLYPNQFFASADIDWYSKPNIMQFIFKEEQGSYLAGLAAALKAQEDGIENPRFGFIGGVPGPTITRFEMGFFQGIKSIFPDAAILDYYANDWSAPNLAKTQAKSWFDNGVFMIFSAAGGTGNGMIAQAKEYRIQNKNVWAIGVDSDQFEDGLYTDKDSAVYTSMIKNVELATVEVLQSVADGTFKGGRRTLGIKEEGVGYTTTNPAMSDAIKERLNKAESDIASGAITVYPTYKETQAAGLAPAGLGALDG
ncbi:MAG: BMP family ABC transporter substrate-binding protein [Spirochaetaceae bacterium]|jgi:basic membrane protein A|nr:BMP family ABC transporter substrate-binding protein [Spirochaetaceae bacterium]